MSVTPGDWNEAVVSASRTTLGDALRAVIVFTPSDHEVVYLRGDLAAADAGRTARREYVDIERGGFADQNWFDRLSGERGTEPEIGEYVSTVRVFTEGFVARVVAGDVGVIVTTDELDVAAFDDLGTALRVLLADPRVRTLLGRHRIDSRADSVEP
jgi:hypothetical protein